jgi:IS30 family transposase
METAIEAVIERDVNAGLYKLKAGPRKEQVKLLADQGLSNRQIAKVLGVHHKTVDRDVAGANAPPTGANAAPDRDVGGPNGPPIVDNQAIIEKAKAEAKAEAEASFQQVLKAALDTALKENEKKLLTTKKELEEAKAYGTERAELAAVLGRNVDELLEEKRELEKKVKGKQEPSFGRQIMVLIDPLATFIQNDGLVKLIHEIELSKEEITSDNDMSALHQLIKALLSLSERAEMWAKRITPTSDRWEYHNQQNGE